MQWIRLGSATTIALGCLAAVAESQAPCIGTFAGVMIISLNDSFPVPNGTNRVFIPATAARSDQDLSSPSGNFWTAKQPDVDKLKSALAAGRRSIAFSGSGPTCTRAYTLSSGGGPGVGDQPTVDASETFDSPEACASEAGPRWEQAIRASRKRQPGNFTLLVFMESGSGGDANICHYNRDYGVAGDPIYVGVFRKDFAWERVKFEPCSVQAAAPNVLQSTDKFPGELQSGEWKLQKFLPRRCFNTAVDVSITGLNEGNPITQRYPLSQYDRYRATLQAGILFTPLHDGDFALRADQADTSKKFIFDRGPTNRGPEYIATLQLYSILRYLPSIWGRPAYPGRDPLNDQKLLDRLGAILGVGIKNPSKRFVAGLSLELIYGVSAIGVLDFARVSRVHGSVSTTEPFQGVAADIPTVLVWKHRTTFGLSVDLRYVATLFSGNR